MKKLILVLVMMLLYLGVSTTAYAGSINSNEQAVLNAAGQTFMYHGTEYRLASSYTSQLQAYLMSDDIDLTAVQRDKALASVNSYIETGVQGGYLVPVKGQSGQQDTESGSGNPSKDTTQGSSDPGLNTSNNSGGENSIANNSGTDNSDNTNSDNTNIGSGSDNLSEPSSDSNRISDSDVHNSQDKSGENVDEFMDDLFTGTSGKDTASHKVTKEKGNSIGNKENSTAINKEDIDAGSEDSENSIIKDTGFDFSMTFAVIALVGVIMIAGMIVTVRSHYFAQSDE